MLIAALFAMLLAVALGLWLSALILIREAPPKRIPVTGLVHGAAGSVAVLLLLLALQGPKRGVHTGAGGFGWTSFTLMAMALAGGVTILSFHLRRRGAPTLLIALHGLLGVAGGVMLAAWWAAPVSVAP
jgi:hypothetical protein